MIDHLAEARRITEGETAYDATALSYGILHALIAIAERMGEPAHAPVLTRDDLPVVLGPQSGVLPQQPEAVDLVAALKASIEAAKERRRAPADPGLLPPAPDGGRPMTRTTPEQRADLARMLDAAMLDAGMSGPWREWGDMWIQLGTTRALIVAAVNALPDLLADLADAEAERDSLTEGVRAYGRTIDRWGKLIIEATGSEDITTPDGDGDWEVVEHRLSEVRAEQERLTVALRLAQARAADAVAATIPEPIEYPTYHDGYETGRRDGEQAARALAERAEVDIDGNLIPTWDLLNFTRRIYAHLQEAERSLKELALTRPTPAESPRPIDPAAERDALAAAVARVRALVDWHETKADKARRFRIEINGQNPVMDKAAEVHADAARRIRVALDGGES